MTAILAYREGKSSWIGGDAFVSDGYTVSATSDAKVWRPMRGVLCGAAGSLAWCDAVAWVDWPSRQDITDAWVRRGLASELKRQLRGFDPEDGDEAIFIVGTRVYIVDGPSGSAYRPRENWAAVGSGAREALSACASATHLSGAIRVRRALEIAGRYAVGVGPPYRVLKG